MAKYGIPYMGSKQAIADEIIKIFPKADHFYDLFGGGFSITHAMLLRRSKSFNHFHFNEIKADNVELIKKSIAGEFNYERFKPEFIGRDEFFARLDDPYIRITWSFGNNQKTYLFSKEIEPYKKSMHNAIVFNRFDDLAKKVFSHDGFKDGYSIQDRRLFLRSRIGFFRLNGIPDFLYEFLNEKQLHQLQRLQQLQQLQRLQQLKQLKQLEQLQRLQFYSKSYDKVPIEKNSIIYCDPPYKDTTDYGNDFDHKRFLDWAHEQNEPVFISEYNIDDKRFKLIKRIKKRSLLSDHENIAKHVEEKIYVNQAAYKI